MSELISVIVPVYNIAPELPRCLDSILAQSFENLEIIAVNDGSGDGSGEVLDHYAAKHTQIQVIHQENAGVTVARLRGVAAAKGNWVGFVDGDDYIEPDMFQHLYDNAVKYGAEISHCGYQMVFADGRVHYFHNTGFLAEQDQITGLKELLSGSRIEPGLWNKLFHKTLFHSLLHAGVMDTGIKINEDLLMNFYLFSAAKKSVFEDWCPYYYMVRQTSASRARLNEHKIFDPIRVRELILEAAADEVKPEAQKAYVNVCLDVCGSILLAGRKEYEDAFRKVRAKLAAQRANFELIGKKRKLMAKFLLRTPGLYGLLWKIYVNYFRKKVYD